VPVGTTRFPLIVRGGTLKNGHRVRYVLNYSARPATLAAGVAPGTELITGRRLGSGDALALSPWGVAVVEED